MHESKQEEMSKDVDLETTKDKQVAASTHELRLRRIREYLHESLCKDDSLESNVGAINSGLLRMAQWIEEVLEDAMSDGSQNLDRLKRLMPAIEAQLKIARQVDRFAQIELRAVEARKPMPSTEGQGILQTPTTPAMPR